MDVAEAAAAAPCRHHGLPDRDEVGDQLAARVVEHGRARRDVEDQVVAGRPVAARALAPAAGRRAEVVLVLEVAEGRLAGIDAKVDRRTSATVAAVRTASRDVRLAPERRGPVTAIAGAQGNLDAIDEHQGNLRTRFSRPQSIESITSCGWRVALAAARRTVAREAGVGPRTVVSAERQDPRG